MAPEIIIPLLSAVLGGSIVAIVNHFLNTRRERKRKLADLRIQTLITSWQKIEAASNIEDWKQRDRGSLYSGLEEAIANVMLLGNAKEIALARDFCIQVSNGSGASALPLLMALRSSLRNELGLENPAGDYMFLRMHRE